MKVVTISYFMPYCENLRGISALIFYLIKYRPVDVEITLYSFNCNHLSEEQIEKVKTELGIPITIIPEPKQHEKYKPSLFARCRGWFHDQDCERLQLSESVISEIRAISPNYIWLYPYYLYNVPSQMPDMKFILTGCDSNALLYKRCMKDPFFSMNIFRLLKVYIKYRKALSTEKKFPTNNCLIHFVGQADSTFYNANNKQENGLYIPHPHYHINDNYNIKFHYPKLKVLIAGSNNFYMKTEAKKMMTCIIDNCNLLSDKIEITFLGRGWDKYVSQLERNSIKASNIKWVENYIDEIIKYDIQLIPISLGTGTKGKTLDAMSNGLLVIGTKYALENIDLSNRGSVLYNRPEDVVNTLIDIFSNRSKYERIAEIGRDIVLNEHNPHKCATFFYNVMKNKL